MGTLYKLNPIDLHNGYRPGGYWKEEITGDVNDNEKNPKWKLQLTKPKMTEEGWEQYCTDTGLQEWDSRAVYINGVGWTICPAWQKVIDRYGKSIWSYTSGYDYVVGTGWVHSGIESKSEYVLRSDYIPDQLIVYIYVRGEEEKTTWEDINDYKEIENEIVEIGTFNMGFDEDEYEFYVENISFKVLNYSGIWDKILLDTDTVAEIRMLYAHPKETAYNEPPQYEEPKALFYGVIDKTEIRHTNNVGFDDEMWGLDREYEFTCLNYFSLLKEKSIMELREAIKKDCIKNYDYIRDRHNSESDEIAWTSGIERDVQKEYKKWWTSDRFEDVEYIVYYIRVEKLFKNIFALVFPDLSSFTIKSDKEFKSVNASTGEPNPGVWYLDSDSSRNDICIYFYINLQGIAVQQILNNINRVPYDVDSYIYSFFDDDVNRTPYSFFKYENCLSLLKELLISFGLVWSANYEVIDDTSIYKWKINFELLERFKGNKKDIPYDDICNDIEGNIQTKEYESVSVSIAGYGDVSNYKVPPPEDNPEYFPIRNLWNKYATTDRAKKLTTPFISWINSLDKGASQFKPHQQGLYVQQCLFGYSSSPKMRMIPINRYTSHFGIDGAIIEDYPNYYVLPYHDNSDEVKTIFLHPDGTITGNERAGSIKIISKEKIDGHILGANHPYYKQFFGEMVANYYAGRYGVYTKIGDNTLSFTIDSVDIELLDIIPLDGKTYIVMQVEKDFVDCNSKLVLKEYKI